MTVWRWGRGLGACCCLIAALAIAGGCGGGSDSHDASAQAHVETAIPTSPPEIELHGGFPPKKLVVKDLWEGTGKQAKKGDRVQLQYYGVQWKAGEEHANSWNYSSAPVFTLGEHQLLRGLTMAVLGMKEGGGREVIIPHNLVYYPGGGHRHLGLLDALIYKVYLVRVLSK